MVKTEVITIDGPTSSGKNSVGFLLAKKLGYQYIDSGMIYRAGCYKALKQNIPFEDMKKILDIYRNLDIGFETNDTWMMFLDGEDVTNKLHTPEISKKTSKVAAIREIREVVKQIQRKLARNGRVVVGGRDIGSEIFPDAKFKFFLTASQKVRAQRRFKQLVTQDPSIKYEDVLNDMVNRDKYDSEREASPMRVPKEAVVIDNSNLTVEQTVGEMLEHIRAYA